MATITIDDSFLDELVTEKINALLANKQAPQEIVWDLNDLCKVMGNKKPEWIREHILYNPRLMKEINELKDKGLLWGGGKGSTWKMSAIDIREFIETHRELIFLGGAK